VFLIRKSDGHRAGIAFLVVIGSGAMSPST